MESIVRRVGIVRGHSVFVKSVSVGIASGKRDVDEMRAGCKNRAGEADDLYVLYTRALPRFEAATKDAAVGTSSQFGWMMTACDRIGLRRRLTRL